MIDAIGLPFILIGTIIFLIAYQCIIRYWTYFSKNNVKFVRGIPFFGAYYRSLLGFEPLLLSIRSVYDEHPNEKVIGIFDLGGIPKYGIHDPELIKRISIKDFEHFTNHQFQVHPESDPMLGRSLFIMRDQRWKDMRSTLSPAFTGSKMKLMFGLIVEVCETFSNHLKLEIKNQSKDYNIIEIIERIANDVIASCAFGININSLEDKENAFFKSGLLLSEFNGWKGFKFISYGALPKLLNLFKVKVLEEKEVNYLRGIVNENIRYREENKIVRNDMINLLLQAKHGTLTQENEENNDGTTEFATVAESVQLNSKVNSVQKWSDDDILAQCLTFFIGGFGTVSRALSFAVHEITVNSDIQQKLYEEIQLVHESLNGKPLSYDALQKMKYIDMIMSETLRRWPQVPAVDRYVNKPYVIEDSSGNKIRLEVGDSIFIPTPAIHMDPKYYPNPENFDPERFSDENKNNIISGTYLPFGIGPRSCIASRFALMECKAILYYLVLNFQLERCEKTQHPLKLKKGPALPDAENGFWIQMRNK